MSDKGPMFETELSNVLPINSGGMKQAMPSRADLEGIKDYRQGHRVVAGYEVLLSHWREQVAEIERLRAIVEAIDALRRKEGDSVAIAADSDFNGRPGCLVAAYGAWCGGEIGRKLFFGETVGEALKIAVEAREAAETAKEKP